jgi:UPF0716 protein FxsA
MRLFPVLLTAFLVVPLLEIYLLIKVGGVIGAAYTILLVIATAILGAWLLRIQGLATLTRAQAQLQRGTLPAREAVEGLLLFLSGALLLTPGFFTDTAGFLLLIPALRRLVAAALLERLRRQLRTTGHTIEADYRIEDDDKK